MIIRKYNEKDEQGWIRCRVVSFLDCSYFNDVKTEKEQYTHPSICLVAQENQVIVGLIDIELDSDALSCNQINERGAILWHMAVLPEYRKQGVAKQLWEYAKKQLLEERIHYCEVWTQEDKAANKFYQSMGFVLEESQTWIRCYIQGQKCLSLLNIDALGNVYGPEELVFDAPVERKEELKELCYRIDEVRLYSCRF